MIKISENTKQLCEAYDIGEPVSFDEIGEGTMNRNYLLVTSKGKYFIKSVREKMKEKLPTIFAVETHMKTNGIPAVAMLATPAGEIFQELGGEVLTVYPFIESDRSHAYGADDFRRMGALLGKIHKVGHGPLPEHLSSVKQFARPEAAVIFERLGGYKEEILKKEKRDETDELFLKYIDFKIYTTPKIEAEELPADTLIHGDYHFGNLLIEKGSREIIGVCDWEKAEYGSRSYELARSLFYMCFEGEQDVETSLKFAKAFLGGYLEIFPMSKSEVLSGIRMRIQRMALSSWIEEVYYRKGDSRPVRFIEHEMLLLDFALNRGLLADIERLLS